MNEINWQDTAAGIGLSVVIAFVVAQLATRVVRLALRVATGGSDLSAAFGDPIQRRPIRLVRGSVFIGTFVVVTRPILQMFDVQLSYGVDLERLSTWLFEHGLRVMLIAVLAYFTIRVAALAVTHFEEVVRRGTRETTHQAEFTQRLHTIGGLVKNATNVLLIGAAALMILQELGVNITPLLTAAGIGGLAVGFGAQNLVRDVISGFFLILEDQVRVRDVVRINDTAGLVESIRLRTIVLRDLSGTVHIIPNGAISTLSNLTKEYSYAVVDVGIAYKEDTDHVSGVLQDVGDDIRADPKYAQHILDKLEILGVNEFGDSAVVIKIRIKTRPLKQWLIGRELRRRIKKAFDAQGIEIPFPHMSLYFGEASKPFLTQHLDKQELTPTPKLARPVSAKAQAKRRASETLDGDAGESSDVE